MQTSDQEKSAYFGANGWPLALSGMPVPLAHLSRPELAKIAQCYALVLLREMKTITINPPRKKAARAARK